MNAPRIAVIGLGKVGLPLAAALAIRGARVRGYDPDPARRALLHSNDPEDAAIRFERGLAAALQDGREHLQACDSVAAAIAESEIAFVIVPTPSMADGRFALDAVEAAIGDIGRAGTRTPGLVVNLVSTVSPGAIAGRIRPLLEATTGLRCGEGISLCYSPALIALGNVLAGFLEPDFAFIGEVDRAGADRLQAFLSDSFIPGVPLRRMSAQSVEIAKIALNNFLTTKISFANLVGQLCERSDGADAGDVLGALGQDSRIGPKCLLPGMGYGGPCLPRDTAALSASLDRAGLDRALPEAVGAFNRAHADFLARLDGPVEGRAVTVLGLAYKAGSNVTIDSAAVALCDRLADLGARVTALDPAAMDMDLSAMDSRVRVHSDAAGALRDCSLLLVTGSAPLTDTMRAMLPANCRTIRLGPAPPGSTDRAFGAR